jgi:hypothetical protein
MLKFTAHRISSGNTLFPDKLEIDAENVTYYKGNLVGYQSAIIARKSIASVSIGSGLLFVDIIIETTGGKKVTASGFKKADAKSIVGELTFNRMKGENIIQNVVVNTSTPVVQTPTGENAQSTSMKMSAEKAILILADQMPVLTLRDIIINTNLEIEEAENALKNLVTKSMAKKEVYPSGKSTYTFSVDDSTTAKKGIGEDPKSGTVYHGTVKRIMNFGAFVEILPGKEGLVHISKLSRKRIAKVTDVVSEGQLIPVKLLEVDKMGRLNLSYVDAED